MEFMTNYKDIQPTYFELANVFKRLRLNQKKQSSGFVFVDEKGEPVVILPKKQGNEKIQLARFIALSYNLADLGILSHPHDLAKMIEQLRMAEKQQAS